MSWATISNRALFGLGTRLAVLGALAALSFLATGQTLYKSVTADGKVIYSDHPPVDAKVLKTITPDGAPCTALPVSAMEQLRRLQALRPASAAPPANAVVLYTASWCGYCAKAKEYLVAKGVGYQEVDIDTPDGLASFAQAGGGRGVPLLVVGSHRVQGFSAAAYDQLFASRK